MAAREHIHAKYEEITDDKLGDRPTVERLDKLDAFGLIHWPKKASGVPNYEYELDYAPRIALQDN